MFFPRDFSDKIYKTFKLQIEIRNFKWLNGSRNWNQLINFMGSVVVCDFILYKGSSQKFEYPCYSKYNGYPKVGGWYSFLLLLSLRFGMHISKSRKKRS